MNDIVLSLLPAFIIIVIAYLRSLAKKNEDITKALDRIQKGRVVLHAVLTQQLGKEEADKHLDNIITLINELTEYTVNSLVDILDQKVFKGKVRKEILEIIAITILQEIKIV